MSIISHAVWQFSDFYTEDLGMLRHFSQVSSGMGVEISASGKGAFLSSRTHMERTLSAANCRSTLGTLAVAYSSPSGP